MTTVVTTILLQVTSKAFKENDFVPSKYSNEKENINPPIEINNVPANCKSLALIIEDVDIEGHFVHWIMWNIDPTTTTINENSCPGIQGINSKNTNAYFGLWTQTPPSIHHYHFKVYALDTTLNMLNNSGKHALEDTMKNHIIARGELIGLYK